MPLTTAIVHPRRFTELARFFPSRCTILRRTDPVVSTFGEPQAGYPTLTGHELIPCSIATRAGNTQEQSSEKRTADSTFDAKTRHCNLDGYYPLIEEQMIAVVDGTEYDIRGVVHQSVQGQTKLMLELIT